jgi:hypothetical protein
MSGVNQRSRFPRFAKGLAPICFLVGLHFAFLAAFFEPAISGPDSNGYMAQARLIAQDGRTFIKTESPAQYVGEHWMRTAGGKYYGQYPPGLPALLAIFFRLWGPAASLWVIPVMASLSLLALYLVCRDWVGARWGLYAAALMAFNPVSNEHALGADSHTSVCFFLLWGLFCLVQYDRSRASGWAATAGLCAGLIPTIRYAEALFLVALAAYLCLSVWRTPGGWRSLLAFFTAASLPLIALAARNKEAFGAFWKTGYSVSGEQSAFAVVNFVRNCLPYLALLAIRGAALLAPLGIAGIWVLCGRRETRRFGAFLGGLVLPISLLYMFYYWHADSFSMRFLLPTFFVYVIAAVWWLKIHGENCPEQARRWSALTLLVMIAWGLPLSVFSLYRQRHDNAALAKITRELESSVDPGSIVVADRGILQQLDFVGAWRLAPADFLHERPGPGHFRGDPVGSPSPSTSEADANEANRAVQASAFRRDVATWAGEQHKVYLIAGSNEVQSFRELLGQTDVGVPLATIDLPPSPDRFGPGFGGPGPPMLNGPPGGGPGWGPGPGGLPPPPPGADGPGGSRAAGSPHPPPPAHFEPPPDGKLEIVEWKRSETGLSMGRHGQALR